MTATEKAEALRANEEKAEVIQAARKAAAEKVEADRAAEAAWAAAEKAAAHKKEASESAATAQAASTSASAAARGWTPQPPSPSSPPFAPPDETVLLNPKLNVLHVRRRDARGPDDAPIPHLPDGPGHTGGRARVHDLRDQAARARPRHRRSPRHQLLRTHRGWQEGQAGEREGADKRGGAPARRR